MACAKEPREFADAAKSKGEDYYKYENYELKFGEGNDYEVVRKLGRGKYSEVYEGVNLTTNEPAVMKFLKPIKVEKI